MNGPIRQPVSFAYIWGDALSELDSVSPDIRIINLETSITQSDDFWKGKGINYRMHPDNIPALTAAGIDICALANNHVLDWGYPGLQETLSSLKQAKMLRRFGNVHYISKKLKYVVMYCNQEDLSGVMEKLNSYSFVKKVEPSYKPFLKVEYENSIPDKAKEYDYKMGI